MRHPPLKRHPSLQLFSRDHYATLEVAQSLIRSAHAMPSDRRRAIEDYIRLWSGELAPHFADEERLLIPLMTPLDAQRMQREHAALRSLASEADLRKDQRDPSGDWTRRLGQALDDHIRWEERQLFVSLERNMSPEQLAILAQETRRIEGTRPRRKGQGHSR